MAIDSVDKFSTAQDRLETAMETRMVVLDLRRRGR
jgi:hypothetical protein